MNIKTKLLKIVNPILFIIMLIQAVSGFGQRYASGDFYVFLARIHFPNGVFLIFLFLIHLYLNWTWVKINFFKPASKK